MHQDPEDFLSVKSDVEVLKKDVSNIHGVLNRMETAIDKIADVSSDVGKILSAQESRLELTEYELRETKRLHEKESDLLHTRISQKESEIKTDIEKTHIEVMDFLHDHDIRSSNSLDHLKNRVSGLEKWKWYVVGISSAVVFLVFQTTGGIEKLLGG